MRKPVRQYVGRVFCATCFLNSILMSVEMPSLNRPDAALLALRPVLPQVLPASGDATPADFLHHTLRPVLKLQNDVLLALVAASQARGDLEVSLHAQCSAEGFYIKNGFVARGEVFEEAGIRHIDMVRTLKTQ